MLSKRFKELVYKYMYGGVVAPWVEVAIHNALLKLKQEGLI